MAIEAVLFDLGNVILSFDHFNIARRLSSRARRKEYSDPGKIFELIFHNERGLTIPFDKGEISPNEFYLRISNALDLDCSFYEFKEIWNEIFSENIDVSNLIRRLKGIVPIYLFSNTNILHFEYIKTKFRILDQFSGFFLSYELGIMKPADPVYDIVISSIRRDPERTLYIDDREENLEPAIKRGIKVIQYRSSNLLLEEMGRYISEL
jgi:putative hydrolase of the HAD superfamily